MSQCGLREIKEEDWNMCDQGDVYTNVFILVVKHVPGWFYPHIHRIFKWVI